MTTEKAEELLKALSSINYEISKINFLHKRKRCYGDIEILIYPVPNEKKSFSKERMIQLINTLFSLGYGIVTYNLISYEYLGDIRLVLQTLSSLQDMPTC